MADLDISYLRVSTVRQRDEETIETQRFTLDSYFKQHGITVDPKFRFEDNGISGGVKIHERPAGKEVYRLISQGRVRRLFLFHADRLGRDTIDGLLFHQLAATHGTQIIGVADGTDTFREGSALTTELKTVIAAEYRRDCVRRTKAGLRRRASNGKISTRPPFGFIVKDDRLAIHDENAAVMAQNFSQVAQGVRTRDIVARLNESGVPSPKGKGWRHDTLIYLLRNSAYAGEYQAFRTPRRRPGGGSRLPRDPSEVISIPCPAIVSREVFDAVQERLIFNRVWCSTSRKSFYLLKSLVRCGKCGRAYIGHTIRGRKYKNKRYPVFAYYECGTVTNRDYEVCGNVRVNAKQLESAIWQDVEKFISSPSHVIDEATRQCNLQLAADQKDITCNRQRIEKAKRKNKEARERLVLAVARGVLPDEDAKLGAEILAHEASELEEQAAELQRVDRTAEQSRKQIIDAGTLLKKLKKQIEVGNTA